MQVKLYGIPNCSTVKKALQWLAQHEVAVEFHNYKKDGLDSKRLQGWLKQVEWSQLLNRSGTTWRKLDEGIKASITTATAATRLMCEQPSLVKRPVIEYGATLLVGFDEQRYKEVFDK